MNRFKKSVSATLFLFLSFATSAQINNKLKMVFVSLDPVQIKAISHVANEFEQANPGVEVHISAYSDNVAKRNIKSWLESEAYDLVSWKSGDLLTSLTEQGYLATINSLLDEHYIKSSIPQNVLNLVSEGERIYAVPYSYYAWGFYFNANIFNRLGLRPPATWEEFKTLCAQLKSQGITPLVQVNANDWETLGWIDFLSLYLGGSQMRDALVSGHPLPEAVTNKLTSTLAELIERDYFFVGDYAWSWQKAYALILREQVAMTLTGQFAERIIRPEASENFGFFPFPESEKHGTVAPLDLFFVPASSQQKHLSARFLSYLLQPDVQINLALDLGRFPVNLKNTAIKDVNTRKVIALQHLQNTPLFVQYFDREASADRAKALNTALGKSIALKDIAILRNALSMQENMETGASQAPLAN